MTIFHLVTDAMFLAQVSAVVHDLQTGKYLKGHLDHNSAVISVSFLA